MATFDIHYLPTNRTIGARILKKAFNEVIMGALVSPGTVAGTVIETAAATSRILGIAIMDETMARQNESADVAQEKYVHDDPVVVEGLVDGTAFNLQASATTGPSGISDGTSVVAAAGGLIAAGTTDQPVGIAIGNPSTTANQQGNYPTPVLIQRMWKLT